ncbi:helix-turn-helix transcriptional regulator [Phenylobacterium sp. LjRoot225]|uniref:helix-turn-helix transcriptional regulator n=1 Tax=Phenylobacterium sp. LjRoot225 TaxID=3342285 RepID=UPI003ECE28D4
MIGASFPARREDRAALLADWGRIDGSSSPLAAPSEPAQFHAAAVDAHAETALDALAIGTLVCDGGGYVLHANAAGEHLVRRAAGLAFRCQPRRLVAAEPAAGGALRRCIAAAAQGGGGGAIAVPDVGDDRLLVLVSPSVQTGGERGCALVLLRSTAGDRSPTEAVLRTLFGLTPTEATIASALANGESALQLAASRRVTESTLRTHLASIFRKTGVDGQRDLVRLLSLLPPVWPTVASGYQSPSRNQTLIDGEP